MKKGFIILLIFIVSKKTFTQQNYLGFNIGYIATNNPYFEAGLNYTLLSKSNNFTTIFLGIEKNLNSRNFAYKFSLSKYRINNNFPPLLGRFNILQYQINQQSYIFIRPEIGLKHTVYYLGATSTLSLTYGYNIAINNIPESSTLPQHIIHLSINTSFIGLIQLISLTGLY